MCQRVSNNAIKMGIPIFHKYLFLKLQQQLMSLKANNLPYPYDRDLSLKIDKRIYYEYDWCLKISSNFILTQFYLFLSNLKPTRSMSSSLEHTRL